MILKTLNQCYKKPSTAKQRIYSACIRKALSDNAIEYGVISFNTSIFTFAYKKSNGEIVIIKPSNFYSMCREFI